MKKYLNPKKGETIIEIGAGSGMFSGIIADIIGKNGKLVVTDPSLYQLEEVKELNKPNIEILQVGAERLNINSNFVDAVWSFGAMHHVFVKEKSFRNFH